MSIKSTNPQWLQDGRLLEGLIMSGPAAIRSAIVAAGILCTAGLINSVAAAPLIPGTISVASTGIAETMQVRWRGHGGGGAGLETGLMTGLIIGGLVAAPHYRSFDPISGTYLGHDGRRHYCG
jgi:BA14K-like protein